MADDITDTVYFSNWCMVTEKYDEMGVLIFILHYVLVQTLKCGMCRRQPLLNSIQPISKHPIITNTPMCEIQPISKHPILTNTLICKIQPISKHPILTNTLIGMLSGEQMMDIFVDDIMKYEELSEVRVVYVSNSFNN
jgi:hypothetical protein